MGKSANLDPERMAESAWSTWLWEKFTVVDGGNGTYAFWNPMHKRFVRMPPALGHLDVSIVVPNAELPSHWKWERFRMIEPLDAAGEVSLWNPTHERYVHMAADADYLESSLMHKSEAEPVSDAAERFRIVVVENQAPDNELFQLVADGTAQSLCPRWHPEVLAVVLGLGAVALLAVAVAVGAVCWALRNQRDAVIAKLLPMALVDPLAPPEVRDENTAERQLTCRVRPAAAAPPSASQGGVDANGVALQPLETLGRLGA